MNALHECPVSSVSSRKFPLLYAAKKAIGPMQLTENEARDTARRAYNKNPALTSLDIEKAIGRSRHTADSCIADLRAVT